MGVFSAGNLTHLAVEAVLVAVVIAGVHEATGCTMAPDKAVTGEKGQWWVKEWLIMGEWIFKEACSKAESSAKKGGLFRRDSIV